MSDLDGLIRDLDRVSRMSPKAARDILRETAEPAKKHWQAAASTGRTASKYARRISYNTKQTRDGAEAEIGARIGGVGSLGILDDPLSVGGMRSTPSRARRDAAKFIEQEFDRRGKVVVDKTLKDAGL